MKGQRSHSTRTLLLVILSIAVAGLFISGFIWYPEWQARQFERGTPIGYRALIDSYRRTYTQAVGAIGAAYLIWLTWKRTTATEKNVTLLQKGQMTERFTRAIDHLGTVDGNGRPRLETRIGAIYALEQISNDDSDTYQKTVLDVLTAYLRENSKRPASADLVERVQASNSVYVENVSRPPGIARKTTYTLLELSTVKDANEKIPSCDSDLLSAAAVIARSFHGHETPLSLADTYLRGVTMSGADLRGIVLARSHIGNSEFDDVDLSPLVTSKGQEVVSNLVKTNWHGTSLCRANLKKANLNHAVLIAVDFTDADLTGANLRGADLTEARGLTDEQRALSENLTGGPF